MQIESYIKSLFFEIIEVDCLILAINIVENQQINIISTTLQHDCLYFERFIEKNNDCDFRNLEYGKKKRRWK